MMQSNVPNGAVDVGESTPVQRFEVAGTGATSPQQSRRSLRLPPLFAASSTNEPAYEDGRPASRRASHRSVGNGHRSDPSTATTVGLGGASSEDGKLRAALEPPIQPAILPTGEGDAHPQRSSSFRASSRRIVAVDDAGEKQEPISMRAPVSPLSPLSPISPLPSSNSIARPPPTANQRRGSLASQASQSVSQTGSELFRAEMSKETVRERFQSVQVLIIVPLLLLLISSNIIIWYLGYRNVQISMDSVVAIVRDDLLNKTERGAAKFLEWPPRVLEQLRREFAAGNLRQAELDRVYAYSHRVLASWPELLLCTIGFADEGYAAYGREYSIGRMLYSKVFPDGRGSQSLLYWVVDRETGVPFGNVSDPTDPRVVQRASNYLPTKRGWYKQALANAGNITWTGAYFMSDGTIGMSTVSTIAGPAGEMLGVAAVGLELENGLSAITEDIVRSYGRDAVAFIVEAVAGDPLVATSEGKTVWHDPKFDRNNVSITGSGTVATPDVRYTAWTVESALVRDIAACLRDQFGPLDGIARREGQRSASAGCTAAGQSMIVVATRLRTRLVDWLIVVAIKADTYTGEARRNAIITGLVALGILALAVVVSVLTAAAITRPLNVLARKMHAVTRMDFSEADSDAIAHMSRLRELQRLASAFASMILGIQAFQRYVPSSIVEAIVRAHRHRPADLELSPHDSTIFFVDLQDFSRMSSTMSPRSLVSVVGAALETLSAAITAHLGTIDKYIGDAIMAFFSSPLAPLPDHAVRACEAALDCQQHLEGMRSLWEARGLAALECRIGIDCGQVLIGNFGSSSRYSYTAIGDHVNAAARLEPLNKRYGTSILISHDLHERVQHRFFCRLVDVVILKGRMVPTRVYELVARLGEESPAQRRYAQLYEEAFSLYRARRFQEAAEGFEAAGRLALDTEQRSRFAHWDAVSRRSSRSQANSRRPSERSQGASVPGSAAAAGEERDALPAPLGEGLFRADRSWEVLRHKALKLAADSRALPDGWDGAEVMLSKFDG